MEVIIERLWDDPAFEVRHRTLARAQAERWDTGRVLEPYEGFFLSLGREPGEAQAVG